MLDPPSESLQKLLKEHQLCSPRDLRRSRRAVLRLARDLPAFDSVWLDALVQIGRLTRYQAKLLESPQRDRIGVGPCVLVDRLGGGPLGETCLARPKAGRAFCALKLLKASDKLTAETRERLEKLVAGLQGFSHPSIATPHTCDQPAGQIVLVSRYAEGPHLAELLVRRGRYPAAIAWEIGRQLIEGLAALEQRKIFHGDIRLANVRLNRQGVAVLVDPGVRSAIDPDLTVHALLPPERYDGIAPELVGSGRKPDSRSDIYALGCLLWQLLAGRPPFPGGDPLGKLAAHQTRAIDDVRKWAPDTPPLLAEALLRCTARDPSIRPDSFQELLRLWGTPSRAGRRLLAAFRYRFDAPAPLPAAHSSSKWGPFSLTAAALFAVSGLAVVLSDVGARTELLSLAGRIRHSLQAPPQNVRQDNISPTNKRLASSAKKTQTNRPSHTEASGLTLPVPDDQGLMVLKETGPYESAEISAVGSLVIRGAPGKQPIILVRTEPLRVWAENLKLENVHLRWAASPVESDRGEIPALALVHAQSLEVQGCTFVASDRSFVNSAKEVINGPTLLGWKMLDLRDPRGGLATVRNSSFDGSGPSLHVASAIQKLVCENCLKTGNGPFLQLASTAGSRDIQLVLTGTTLRQSGALIRWRLPADWPARRKLRLEATDCVFDLAPGGARLLELQGDELRVDAPQLIQVGGEGSLGQTNLELAAWIDSRTGVVTPLDPAQLDVAGIFAGPFKFAGPVSLKPADAAVVEYDAPRRSPSPPGIKPAALPVATTP